MLHHAVLPILRQIVPPPGDLEMRVLRIAGLGESLVEERVGRALLALGLELGYCARPSEVDVRLIGSHAEVSRGETIVRATLGDAVVSNDQRSIEQVVVDLLRQDGRTLATAESCTGGALAHRLTNVPGASRVFLAGFITYANEAKIRDLAVDPALLASHGAVSAPIAAAMAEGACNRAAADFALSTTGIAGPDGGTAEKPVGTVFIALAAKGAAPQIVQHAFPRDRETFKVLVVQTALELLRQKLIASARAS
jgi:nicotinamide-nucleotide amidase